MAYLNPSEAYLVMEACQKNGRANVILRDMLSSLGSGWANIPHTPNALVGGGGLLRKLSFSSRGGSPGLVVGGGGAAAGASAERGAGLGGFMQGRSVNYNRKLLHLSAHPTLPVVVCAAGDSGFLFHGTPVPGSSVSP